MKTKISILLVLIMLISLFCSACKPCDGHVWNNGELTKAPTVSRDGKITYTCVKCEKKQREKVPAGTKLVTRGELEQAVVETAWAYYMKGAKVQYDSISLTKVSTNHGGNTRHIYDASPEDGTSDSTIYSVCTDFTCSSYYDAIGRRVFEGIYSPSYLLTFWHWMCADNQPEKEYIPLSGVVDPITENDRDMALVRWVDYDRYSKNNAWELPYCEELQVFSSSAFTDWYGKKLEFKKDGDKYYYYQKGAKLSVEDSKMLVADYILETKKGKYVNLRPGDVFVEDGHALIYIGGDRVLDCAGGKYDTGNGTDKKEEKGAIYGRMKTVESVVKEDMSEDFVLIRPLDYYAKDYDGKPENDIIKYKGENIEIPEKTLSRQQYPAMEIDRTVNITPYGTASANEEITYSVKITNNTTEKNYKLWRGNGYNGQDYNGLTVTETVPTGTEFVSATGNPEQSDGKLTWNVNIPAGESVEVTYTVKVTAEIGSVITNDGGFVANIPSNSISNRVGGKKLNDTQLASLKEVAKNIASADYGEDTAFAENIYKAFGVELQLPTVAELVENLFTPTRYDSFKSLGVMYNDLTTPITMYTPQKTVSAEYEVYQKMLIDGYCGGYRLYNLDMSKVDRNNLTSFDFNKELNTLIKEFKFDYLEPGDIIIQGSASNRGDLDLSSEMNIVTVWVYAGDNTLICKNRSGNVTALTSVDARNQLESSFWSENDIFFALRPSQANLI